MSFIRKWFSGQSMPTEMKREVESLVNELCQIGTQDDFLSERPGGAFNAQCRHIHAREIGKRLHELGGFDLMENVQKRVKRKLGKNLSDHLEYAWAEIGNWLP
jgi:hypothetical protein